MRRAKIVCTLGPAVSTPEGIRELVDAGMDVARLNMSHGEYADHERLYNWSARPATRPVTASASSPTSRAPRSGWAVRRRTGEAEEGRHLHDHHPRHPGHVDVCGTTYAGLPGDVKPGDPLLIDDGKVRLRVTSVDDTDVRDRGRRRRQGLQQQGHQPARCRRVRAGAVGEGHRGPALGAQPRRRLHRPQLRPQRRRRRGRARDHARGEHLRPDHRQDREAAGDRQHRRDRRRLRRRSWSPAATSAWSARSRTCRSTRS